MKTIRARLSRWCVALWSIPSGWLVLLLLGLLYGLANLKLLPPELGFPGSAALVLAAYFLCRDLFRADSPSSGRTEENTPAPPERRRALIGAAVVVLVFMTGASVYYAAREERLKQKSQVGERNLTPEQLSASTRPDTEVKEVWITFQSAAGYSYTAVHAFPCRFRSPSSPPELAELGCLPQDPYIRLSSTDKQREDFERVSAQLAQSYGGTAEGDITDGDDDISDAINVPAGFTQKGIAAKLTQWFAITFKNSKIEVVYYNSDTK